MALGRGSVHKGAGIIASVKERVLCSADSCLGKVKLSLGLSER
jgi:hypothetical protein